MPDSYKITEVTTSELKPGEFVGYVGFSSEKHGKEHSYVGGYPTSDESNARLWACEYAIAKAKMEVE